MHFAGALGERQHHEQRLLGDRRGIRGARNHQRHLAPAEGRDVDRIETDTDPRYHLHVAGGFELGAALVDGDGFAHLVEAHVVEQDHPGAGGEGFLELAEVLDFDFDEHV